MQDPKSEIQNPESILVRCPNWIGDAVMATPALRALRRRFPQARITLAAKPHIRDVLEPGPFHDDFITLTGRPLADARILRRARADSRLPPSAFRIPHCPWNLGVLLTNSFSTALALRLAGLPRRLGYDGNVRGRLLTPESRIQYSTSKSEGPVLATLDAYLALVGTLGCPTDDRRMELAVSPADQEAAEELLVHHPPLVLIAPGAAYGSAKSWPAERFGAVADALADRLQAPVVLAAAPAEAPVTRAVAQAMRHPALDLAARRTSIGLLKALVRRAAIVVTNDSGPRHIAAAFDRPVVALFGPTDPRAAETYHPREVRLVAPIACAPCRHRTCPTDHRCMTAIPAASAIAACFSLLDRS
jgi:heptosyltransferase-2